MSLLPDTAGTFHTLTVVSAEAAAAQETCQQPTKQPLANNDFGVTDLLTVIARPFAK